MNSLLKGTFCLLLTFFLGHQAFCQVNVFPKIKTTIPELERDIDRVVNPPDLDFEKKKKIEYGEDASSVFHSYFSMIPILRDEIDVEFLKTFSSALKFKAPSEQKIKELEDSLGQEVGSILRNQIEISEALRISTEFGGELFIIGRIAKFTQFSSDNESNAMALRSYGKLWNGVDVLFSQFKEFEFKRYSHFKQLHKKVSSGYEKLRRNSELVGLAEYQFTSGSEKQKKLWEGLEKIQKNELEELVAMNNEFSSLMAISFDNQQELLLTKYPQLLNLL